MFNNVREWLRFSLRQVASRLRAIERVKKVHHTTIINWVKEIGRVLPDAPAYDEIPEITQVDELETFIG